MKASERAGAVPQGLASPPPRWLLIGNSRWHFARPQAGRLHCWSEAPPQPLPVLWGWAAVGRLPPGSCLDHRRRIDLAAVPLGRMPPWLGIDRALAGWQAWSCSGTPVLVADAGTALSLTLVDGQGRFVGGRIQAGLALQRRALAAGTALLPEPGPDSWAAGPTGPWPRSTEEAMLTGVREGLVAAVEQAWREAREHQPGCRLWLTGGDGGWIAERLGLGWEPCLALAALARLRPADEPGQAEDLSSGPDR